MDLLILAAGMAKRFGGNKQITPIDDKGNFIIDYTINDAIKIGFDRVVFVIKKEMTDIFTSTVIKRIKDKINVDIAYQSNEGLNICKDRIKPLGTGHALLCAKDKIKGKFVVVNSDDYYGYEGLKAAYDYMNSHDDCVNVAYKVINTLSLNGTVKRGVLDFDSNNNLVSFDESKIYMQDGKLIAKSMVSDKEIIIQEDRLVSMNLIGLSASVFNMLDKLFNEFLINNKDSLENEFLLTSALESLIIDKKINMKVIPTTSKWIGMTYKEDLEKLMNQMKEKST